MIAMKDTVYLLIKVEIDTNYRNIQDAIGEVQRNTIYTVIDSKNVKVIDSKIMDLRTKRK
jgi:anti-anti-sigma regulatory factor